MGIIDRERGVAYGELHVLKTRKQPPTLFPRRDSDDAGQCELEVAALRKPGRKIFAQRSQRTAHARFYRLDGNAEALRDLGVLETARATELEHFATRCGQRRDRALDGCVELLGNEMRERCRRARRVSFGVRLATTLDLFAANMVQRAVARRLKEVCPKRFRDVDALATTPELEHDVLYELLGDGVLSKHRRDDTYERPVIVSKDRVEGILVAASDAPQEFPVVHVSDMLVGDGRYPERREPSYATMRSFDANLHTDKMAGPRATGHQTGQRGYHRIRVSTLV